MRRGLDRAAFDQSRRGSIRRWDSIASAMGSVFAHRCRALPRGFCFSSRVAWPAAAGESRDRRTSHPPNWRAADVRGQSHTGRRLSAWPIPWAPCVSDMLTGRAARLPISRAVTPASKNDAASCYERAVRGSPTGGASPFCRPSVPISSVSWTNRWFSSIAITGRLRASEQRRLPSALPTCRHRWPPRASCARGHR